MNKLYRLFRYDWPLHFVLLFTDWLPDNVTLIKFRGFLARIFFKKAGANLQIGRGVTFYDPSKISLGNNVYIARGCWFSAGGGIEIGNDILFGPYVVVVTSNHSLKNGAYFWGATVDKEKVIFKDGCWIGAHVSILPGSSLGKGSLIAANSVLSGSTEEFSIYAGVPARLIKYAF
jgi:acetyltransferase-like isoleucine patch superfamily enzyme